MNTDRFSVDRNQFLDPVDHDRREAVTADKADHHRDSNPQPEKVKPVRLVLSRRAGYSLQYQSMMVNGLKAVNCARPGAFGNPHRIGWCVVCGREHDRTDAIAALKCDIERDEVLRCEIKKKLRGKNLACFCKLGEACHCDSLLQIANS